MSVKEKRVKLTATVRGNHSPSGGDCEEEGGLEQGDHPLLNDVVLETLFGFVRPIDLKAYRGVCRKWNTCTIPHMRSHFKVTIHGSQSNAKTGQDTHRIDHFMEIFSSNELGIPFTKFELGPFGTTDGVGRQFLQLCGETAKEIDLAVEESDVYVIEDVSELLRSSPKLQVLSLPNGFISRSGNIVKLFHDSIPTFSCLKEITFRADSEKTRLKFCPTLILELLTAAHNISHIVVVDEFEEEENKDGDTGRNLNVVLNCIEKLGKESTIQSLHLETATIKDIEHLQRMAKNGLKLKSLTLQPYSNVNDLEIQLATCLKDSLQHFDMQGFIDNILMEFPVMPKLKSLTQRIKHGFNSKAINLNKNFPALETLDIGFQGNNEEDWDKFFKVLECCPTLKSLFLVEEHMTIYSFHNILRVFLNLTKFSLRIGADGVEVLRQIWSKMTGLKLLSVWGYIERKEKEYLDSLFTGIPTHELKKITHLVNNLDKMTVEERKETIEKIQNGHSQLPSLRNLTKLRHLDLRVSGGEDCHNLMNGREIHLTDFTAYLALYSMNHLRHLNLSQCDFTQTCCEILVKETGLRSWCF